MGSVAVFQQPSSMEKGEDSALWSEIGGYAAVFSVAIALYTFGVALAFLDQLLAWLDTLVSTMFSVFSAIVTGVALFRYQSRETDGKKREDLALLLEKELVDLRRSFLASRIGGAG